MLANRIFPVAVGVLAPALLLQRVIAERTLPAAIAIDYPLDGPVFPPEFIAPTFLFRDASDLATSWRIDIAFADGAPGLDQGPLGTRPQAPGKDRG